MENFWKRACIETGLAALTTTIFSLFAAALFAVFVRAYAPSGVTITIVNQILKCAGVFVCSLIFIRRERALFKGAAAGVLALLLTALIFGMIGGFHAGVFFLLELLLAALFGGLGAICGGKLRKD